MRLKDLEVSIMAPNGAWERRPLLESPYLTSLQAGDRRLYDRYRTDVLGRHWPDVLPHFRTWERHLELVRSIRTHGFAFRRDEPIVLLDGNVIADGQHRICVLALLHGADAVLGLADGRAELDPPCRWYLASDGRPCRIAVGGSFTRSRL